MKSLSKNKSLLVRLLLSGGLIVVLFYSVEVEGFSPIIKRSQVGYLLVALLIALADRVIMAYKWSILLKAREIKVPLVSLTGTYFVTTFLGLFLPATVGADALRAYAVSKGGHKSSDVVSSILIERVLGIITLLVFVFVSVLMSVFVFGNHFFDSIWKLFWIISVLLAVIFLCIGLSVNKKFLKVFVSFFGQWGIKLRRSHLGQKIEEIYYSYKSYQNDIMPLVLFFFLSCVENLFPILWTYFLSLAFGIEVPLLYFFILIPIVLVLVRLPISLDGIGIQEGAFVYFLSLIGISHSESLLLGIASHLVAILSILPGGVLYSFGGLSLNPQALKHEQIFDIRKN